MYLDLMTVICWISCTRRPNYVTSIHPLQEAALQRTLKVYEKQTKSSSSSIRNRMQDTRDENDPELAEILESKVSVICTLLLYSV